MGITLFRLEGLLAPLQSLLGWGMSTAAPATKRREAWRPAVLARRAGQQAQPGCGRGARPAAHQGAVDKPLRVLRVVEASHTPAGAGRMVISGRMDDVCAELDRLAALEAAAT